LGNGKWGSSTENWLGNSDWGSTEDWLSDSDWSSNSLGNDGWGLTVNDSVESVDWVSSVGDGTDGTIGLNKGVLSLNDISVAGFSGSLGISSKGIRDGVSVVVLWVWVEWLSADSGNSWSSNGNWGSAEDWLSDGNWGSTEDWLSNGNWGSTEEWLSNGNWGGTEKLGLGISHWSTQGAKCQWGTGLGHSGESQKSSDNLHHF